MRNVTITWKVTNKRYEELQQTAKSWGHIKVETFVKKAINRHHDIYGKAGK